ncbi:FdhF/YdeP family oxidoreductase [Variovorax saccharolyticus]|uniref:FdhF/YdeP family oxidoreductase n=1 Tax=Variovorax saccharolyticus TaxID=3053516 RepID=UPI0025764C90|nr:FdhF/YdeP family oxidoreductase [Variovorax sp. J31P216]MDM0028805.1 FdhF/YdeP family oxidoreductase [Variovorax sp. J31P216]
MTQDRPEGIRDYDAPAGGWGAVKALAQTITRQQILVQGPSTLLRANQPEGFDCPGCAWPDPKHTSSFEFCENGAKAITWESTSRRVGPEFFAEHTVSSLWLQSDHWLEDQGRLTHPVRYNAALDRFEPVEWQEAFDDIGTRLGALDTPDEAEFYTSGRTSNEAAFLYQLFVRNFGTNNFPDCSNMCHEATSVGLPQSIGIGKATVTLEDFDHTDLIISMGHNPGTNHPRMMTTLREVARRGAKIIVFNPMKERALERFEAPQSPLEMVTLTSTPIATTYLQVKVGGDAAALSGVCKALLSLEERARVLDLSPVLDHTFIESHTTGYAALVAGLGALSWTEIERVSGLSRQALEEVAEVYAQAKATIVCYGMGVTQHRTGTTNVQQIANLLLLRGNMGRLGAGISPLRGHSNVQGDRTVGISERPTEAFLDRLRDVFGFEPPRRHGHSVVEAIAAMRDGQSKAIVCLGGNLAIASSDPQACFDAFEKVGLAVHIATKLNRTHLLTKGTCYLLPCLGRTDLDLQASGKQRVTVEDSMSMVHASSGFLTPPSDQLRSEPAIVAGIAKATLGVRSVVDWDALVEDYDRIRDLIEAILPDFEDFNVRVRQPGGFQLPNSAQQRIWKTASGKATFHALTQLEERGATDDPQVLRLTSVRSHDQYNTTIYGLDDRYRGVFGRRDVLFLNEAELTRLGMKEGDVVDVRTALANSRADRVVQGLMLVRHDLPDGCCASYYPESQPLIALEHHDPQSKTPAYKSVPVRIVAAASGRALPITVDRAGVMGRTSVG